MIPVAKIIWHELTTKTPLLRLPETSEIMNDLQQVKSYVKAYEWGGPTSSLQLYHLNQLSKRIRPGDTVLDLACGPGALLLELAQMYPETKFIGVDLSPLMLEHLKNEVTLRKLENVKVIQEDIRYLPSLSTTKVDFIVSTSALHHLPDVDSLKQVFIKCSELIKEDGGFYFFDFALLRSINSQKLLVADLSRLAPPLTTQDYEESLKAAFPIQEALGAAKNLTQKFSFFKSPFVDFFYFIKTPERTRPGKEIKIKIHKLIKNLSLTHKIEYFMMAYMNKVIFKNY